MVSALLVLLMGQGRMPAPGDPLETFALRAADGGGIVQWTPGRTTIISVVAYWCDTWKVHLARLAEASRKLEGSQTDFIVVSVDGRWEKLAPDCKWASRRSDPGGWAMGLGIDKIPFTMVVSPEGTVKWSRVGVARSADLVDAVVKPREGTGAREIYLTFDDFPGAKGDEELLDILRREGVRATLFCIGVNAEKRTPLVERAVLEGHTLQMHGWTHDGAADLPRLVGLLERISGVKPTLFRPPGSSQILRGREVRRVANVVDPMDYRAPGKKELLRRVLNAVRSGSVIQLHSGVLGTREALPELIGELRLRGYSFETLAD